MTANSVGLFKPLVDKPLIKSTKKLVIKQKLKPKPATPYDNYPMTESSKIVTSAFPTKELPQYQLVGDFYSPRCYALYHLGHLH